MASKLSDTAHTAPQQDSQAQAKANLQADAHEPAPGNLAQEVATAKQLIDDSCHADGAARDKLFSEFRNLERQPKTARRVVDELEKAEKTSPVAKVTVERGKNGEPLALSFEPIDKGPASGPKYLPSSGRVEILSPAEQSSVKSMQAALSKGDYPQFQELAAGFAMDKSKFERLLPELNVGLNGISVQAEIGPIGDALKVMVGGKEAFTTSTAEVPTESAQDVWNKAKSENEVHGWSTARPFFEKAIARADNEFQPIPRTRQIGDYQKILDAGKYTDKEGKEKLLTPEDRINIHRAILDNMQRLFAPSIYRNELSYCANNVNDKELCQKLMVQAATRSDWWPIDALKKESQLLATEAQNPLLDVATRTGCSQVSEQLKPYIQFPIVSREAAGVYFYNNDDLQMVRIMANQIALREKRINGADLKKDPSANRYYQGFKSVCEDAGLPVGD